MELQTRLMKLIQDEDSELPTLSAVVEKIISVASDPQSTAEELAEVISYDQGMTHKLLKLANSIFYAQRTAVASVKRAIAVIGFNEIIGISLGMKVLSSFRDQQKTGVAFEALWLHGICVAIASKEMAKRTDPGLAAGIFIPGLLHDTGKMIFTVYFREEYQKIKLIAAQKKVPLYAAERIVFGMDHAQLSTLLMKRWHFPESILVPCGCHHDPDKALPEYRPAALLINLADYISHRAGIGKLEHPLPTMVKHRPEKIGISPAILKLTIDYLRRKEDEIKEFYNIVSEG